MDLQLAEEFLFWCLVLNVGIYSATAISALAFRRLLCNFHEKLFGMEEATVMKSVQSYLASYKLLITFFNFTPWIAVLIIN